MSDEQRVFLQDQYGQRVAFDFLDEVEYEGEEYVILAEVKGDGEVTIMKCIELPDSEEVEYRGVNDERILDAVFEIFRQEHEDECE